MIVSQQPITNLFQKEKKKFYFEMCIWNLYVIWEDSSHYIIDNLCFLRRASHLHLDCAGLIASFHMSEHMLLSRR